MAAETALVEQREKSDCAICCIAMATGLSYEEVMAAAGDAYQPGKGTNREYEILQRLGYKYTFERGEPVGDIVARHRDWCISPEFFRSMLWGRRALVSVPSVNFAGGHHMVYWDGRRIWDPSRLKRYETVDQLLPDGIVLFREVA